MLSTIPTRKTKEGVSREKPSDLPRATAHTASKAPERTRTSQAMTDSKVAVVSRSGYGSLVR